MPRDGEQCAWRSCPIRTSDELDQQRVDGELRRESARRNLERNSETVLLIFAGSGAPFFNDLGLSGNKASGTGDLPPWHSTGMAAPGQILSPCLDLR